MSREEKKMAFMRILSRYIPREAVDWAAEFVLKYSVKMKITPGRSSKLGDYRHPFGKDGHQITINHDLNPVAFLVTFVHEAAHLEVWVKYRNSVAPHGKEWQAHFARLMKEVISLDAFPHDVVHHFLIKGDNLAASSCSDLKLNKILRKYDPPKPTVLLEELEEGTRFRLDNGDIFEKGPKQRTRFKCMNLTKQRMYLVSVHAEVYSLDGTES